MCDPVTLAVVGIAVGGVSAFTSYESNKSAAQTAQANNDQAYAENKRANIDSATLQEQDLNLRESQNLLATSTAEGDIQKEANTAVSTSRASAAEAGVSGNSVDALQNDIELQGKTQRDRIDVNNQMAQLQIEQQKQAVLTQAQSNINTYQRVQVQQPNILTPILATTGSALQAITYIDQRNAAANKAPTNEEGD